MSQPVDARGISVVIPVRNAASTLAEQLDALAAAESPSGGFEVIIADNGSTDDTVTIAESFATQIPVRIIDAGAAPGSNYARNCGIAAARYGRILLCDGDDQVDTRWLTAMCRAFDGGYELVAGPIDYERLNPPHVRRWRGADRASTGIIMNFLESGHGANLGFSKDLWKRLSGFDEAFEFGGPDIEFCWRAQLSGTALETVPDAVVHYRLRPSLSKLYKQSRAYGAAEAHLYKKFAASGLARRPTRAPFLEAWWMLTRFPFAIDPGRRGAWVRRAGQQVGRLEGSVRYNVLWW
ncbi:glycosyltransferase [Knoellia sp. S7-12]|uniref:glycosyltransferase family 2 protein n=1 Tax=Knoellia sp. S7-12 TaxID=3126698 RepID=UPI003366BE70